MKYLNLIRGKVRHGNKRGRRLGFPTANVYIHRQITEGVYASQVLIDKKIFYAATFIGRAETFNERKYQSETYILHFDKIIYDKWISVKLYKKLRGSKKFNSEKALIDQMQEDVESVKRLFKL